MHTHTSSNTLHNAVTLTFDLMVTSCQGPAVYVYGVWCW